MIPRAGDGDRLRAGDFAACRARRDPRRARAAQQEISASPNCWTPAAPIPALSNARRITFEYVMLKGVNDSLADARELVRLLRGIPAKINLIPFNPWPGAPYECSDWEQIEKFAEIVNRAGYASPGAHAARPRHHGRLRPAQKRKREAARERTSGRNAVGGAGADAAHNGGYLGFFAGCVMRTATRLSPRARPSRTEPGFAGLGLSASVLQYILSCRSLVPIPECFRSMA